MTDFTAIVPMLCVTLAALAACASPPANPHEVREQDVPAPTPDGMADGYFVHPASGRHPGVLMWPDIRGIRPAFRAMGKRLAQSGYAVLVVMAVAVAPDALLAAEGPRLFFERARAVRSLVDPTTAERIGLYDSRVVAYAWFWSEAGTRRREELIAAARAARLMFARGYRRCVRQSRLRYHTPRSGAGCEAGRTLALLVSRWRSDRDDISIFRGDTRV